ncbi:MAG TPA: MFS transporter [Bryobacteraceae bacterium]|jgi:ACS family tartrate transporter-like MFS transporter|nr:MFS transporter [Bryobacteraceae bacterium]
MTPTRESTPVAERTRRRINRRLMPFLFLLYIIAFLDRINVSFAGLDMTRELGFSDSVFGLGSGIFFAGYVLLEIPGALFVEVWSARKWIARIMISWGLVGSLTGLIHTAHQFYWARFILGVAEAGFFPGIVVYLTHWYREQDRARAMAVFMSAIPIAQVVGAPISGALLQIHWLGYSGWRWLLFFEGVPAVIAGVVALFYLTDRPRDARWLPDEERVWITSELEGEARQKHAAATSLWGAFWHIFQDRDVILLIAVYFFGSCAQYGFSFWLPKMIQKVSGFGSFEVAMIATLPFLASWPMTILLGWSSDRTGERRWHTAAAYVILAAGLAGSVWAGDHIALGVVMFSLAAIGISARLPAFWALPASLLGGATAAASIGAINCLGNLGGLVGPYVLGALSTSTGSYSAGIWCLTGASVLAAVLILLVRSKPVRRVSLEP